MAGPSAAFLEELLQCSLCHDMMWEPASLCCGHSFCRQCLQTALRHRRECPMCRAPCYTAGVPRANLALAAILREAFPDHEAPASPTGEGGAEPALRVLPLFLASSVQLPHGTCSMHLFEPRYRLLARRALDGGGDFAMVWARGGHGFPLHVEPASLVGVVGCIVHIEQSQETPDGRWNLLCEGRTPARIEECWVEAGTADLYMARLLPRAEEELAVCAEEPVPAGAAGGGEAAAPPAESGEEPAPAAAAAGEEAVAPRAESGEAHGAAGAGADSSAAAEGTAAPTSPASPAEQLRFLCAQLHALGLAADMQTPPPDAARFTWEAAAALAGPFGYIGLPGLQAVLEQGSLAERLSLLCGFCREASAWRWSPEAWLRASLRHLGPLAVLGAAAAWLLSAAGSRWAGH